MMLAHKHIQKTINVETPLFGQAETFFLNQ